MEINKQLFEDVLSGKLEGTFVLRDGRTRKSYGFKRNDSFWSNVRPYSLFNITYTSNGEASLLQGEELEDIIDFIPDTDMNKDELTIEIPEGKIVDWDESKKQNKIVLKDKQLTYSDICRKLFSKLRTYYFVNNHGNIYSASSICNPYISNPNSATTEHQLECILAKNKLANVAKYLNGEWEPYKTDVGHFDAYVLYTTPKRDHIGIVKISHCSENSNVLFKSRELAQQAIEILGEETVKLALEPLGI